MGIKSHKTVLGITGVFVIGILLLSFYQLPTIEASLFEPENPPLINKVFTFLAPEDELIFPEVYLEKEYTYYFWLEVVTPHNCTINITLWDTDDFEYDIFHSELIQDEWREIPFGTAINGIYVIKYEITSVDNLNIYIRLLKGEECLKEKIPSQLFNRKVFYRVNRFTKGMSLSHYIEFDTDVSYRFYMGRVSSISLKNSSEVTVDYYIYDPNDIALKIYNNTTLPSVDEINYFNFGTAQSGVYIINITIHSNIDAANIGYAICWDYRVADPTNNTGPPTNHSDDFSQLFSLPSEMMTGMVIITGMFIGILLALSLVRKRKRVLISSN